MQQFFSNTSDIPTAEPSVVSNVTAPNQTTISDVSDNAFSDAVQIFLPILTVLMLILYLFRMCYKALRDDASRAPFGSHYSEMAL